MDEGKNPNPRIFMPSELHELQEYIKDFQEQMEDESTTLTCPTTDIRQHLAKLISTMSLLTTALKHSEILTESDMHSASITFHDTEWEFFQIMKEQSYLLKLERQQQWGQTAESAMEMEID